MLKYGPLFNCIDELRLQLPKTIRKTPKANSDEFTRSEIEELIKQGRIEKDGAWYRINDIEVLSHEFSSLIKRISVNKQEMLVQLYS